MFDSTSMVLSHLPEENEAAVSRLLATLSNPSAPFASTIAKKWMVIWREQRCHPERVVKARVDCIRHPILWVTWDGSAFIMIDRSQIIFEQSYGNACYSICCTKFRLTNFKVPVEAVNETFLQGDFTYRSIRLCALCCCVETWFKAFTLHDEFSYCFKSAFAL